MGIGVISPAVTRPVLPTGYRPVIDPGAATMRRSTWPECFAAVALAHGQHQHGGVVAGVQPRIWLRHDVSPLQMSPPR